MSMTNSNFSSWSSDINMSLIELIHYDINLVIKPYHEGKMQKPLLNMMRAYKLYFWSILEFDFLKLPMVSFDSQSDFDTALWYVWIEFFNMVFFFL